MIPSEVLDQLRDIQAPPSAGPWPPAPGWWLLAALVMLMVALITFWSLRRHRRHRPRRQALARLASYPIPDSAGPDWYAGLNRLLKETALSCYPADTPASLSGDQWSHFLARTSGNPQQPWQQLVTASYRPGSDLPPAEAIRLVEQWIRRQPW